MFDGIGIRNLKRLLNEIDFNNLSANGDDITTKLEICKHQILGNFEFKTKRKVNNLVARYDYDELVVDEFFNNDLKSYLEDSIDLEKNDIDILLKLELMEYCLMNKS